MGKRAATPVAVKAGAPAWKKFRGNGIKSKVNTIVSALRDTALDSKVPESARSMLAEGAHAAFASANRHKFQLEMSGLILETLQDIAKRLQEKVDAAQRDAKALAVEQEAELTTASEALAQAKGEVVKKVEEHQQAKNHLFDLEKAFSSLESEGVSLNRRRDQQVKEQAKFSDFMDNMLKVLLEEGPEAGGSQKSAKKLCDKLMKQVALLGAEPALQAAAPSVLLKKKEERQGFDTHVIESVQGLLTGRQEEIQKNLDAIAEEEKAREPGLTAKTEELKQAKAQLEERKQQLDSAEDVACEKEVNVVKIKTLLEDSGKMAEEKAKAIENAEAELKVFGEVLQIYQELEGVEEQKTCEVEESLAPEAAAPAVVV